MKNKLRFLKLEHNIAFKYDQFQYTLSVLDSGLRL